MAFNPSGFTNGADHAFHPVEQVSWNDIRGSYLTWPGSVPDPTSFLGRLRARTGIGIDLSTEAQWEYACRAGTVSALNSGRDLFSTNADAGMDQVGWYIGNHTNEGDFGTHAVGLKSGNSWSLFDMHGNVGEWTLDSFGFYTGDEIDPVGPAAAWGRAVRSGGWGCTADRCRSAWRVPVGASDRYNTTGFRLAAPTTD